MATFPTRPDGYFEPPSRDAARRFAEKAYAAMDGSGADLLYLELSPRGLDVGTGQYTHFGFGLDPRWDDDLMGACQPLGARWPTVVYTALWTPGQLAPFTSRLLGMNARWHGSDTSGAIAKGSVQMDAIDMSARGGIKFLIEGPAAKPNSDLLKYGCIATSWWLRHERVNAWPGVFRTSDHNPREPRLGVYQEGVDNAVDPTWSGKGSIDMPLFAHHCWNKGITPVFAPWGVGKFANVAGM